MQRRSRPRRENAVVLAAGARDLVAQELLELRFAERRELGS